MGPIKGLIGAAIGGAIGAAIWAAVAYNTGYEVGYIAWSIGLLCGLGAMALARSDADAITGVIAAVVAIASVAGGKYLAVHYFVADILPAGAVEIDAEAAQLYMAADLVGRHGSDAKPLKWPERTDEEAAWTLDDYPAEIKKDVLARWNAMNEPDQQAYRASVKAQYEYQFAQVKGEIQAKGEIESAVFFESIGVLDIVFFGLAIVTAFKVGSGIGFSSDD